MFHGNNLRTELDITQQELMLHVLLLRLIDRGRKMELSEKTAGIAVVHQMGNSVQKPFECFQAMIPLQFQFDNEECKQDDFGYLKYSLREKRAQWGLEVAMDYGVYLRNTCFEDEESDYFDN